jgi:hypothetical protein
MAYSGCILFPSNFFNFKLPTSTSFNVRTYAPLSVVQFPNPESHSNHQVKKETHIDSSMIIKKVLSRTLRPHTRPTNVAEPMREFFFSKCIFLFNNSSAPSPPKQVSSCQDIRTLIANSSFPECQIISLSSE